MNHQRAGAGGAKEAKAKATTDASVVFASGGDELFNLSRYELERGERDRRGGSGADEVGGASAIEGGDAAFEVAGMLPGEPLFVPRPGGAEEDDGVLLSMGTDPDGGSSLYVLAAQDMRLLAQCRSPVPLPAGFHGIWAD